MRRRDRRSMLRTGAAFLLGPCSIALLGACGGHENAFSAPTDDEYTGELSSDAKGPIIDAPMTKTPNAVTSAAAKGGGGGTGGSATSTTGGTTGSVSTSTAGSGSSTGVAVTTGTSAGSSGSDGGIVLGLPSGTWSFDDCNPSSPFLVDGTGNGANAQHALGSACVPGISGLAIDFRNKKDVVQIADEPQFQVAQRVAVAAWIHPNDVQGDHPVVLKRLSNQTAFSLGVHDGNIEFSVILTSGTTVRSRAPIDPNTWTHVAGMYDGRFLRLFMNGEQVGQVLVQGTIRNVVAPIRIGATTQSQFFDGIIDEVWLSTNAVTPDQIAGLACVTKPMSFVASPLNPPAVQPDTPVDYTISVTNNDIGFCPSKSYFLSIASGGFGGNSSGGVVGGGFTSIGGDGFTAGGGTTIGGSSGGSDGGRLPPPVADAGDAGVVFSFDGGTGRSTGGSIGSGTGFGSSTTGGISLPNDGIGVLAPITFFSGVAPGATVTFPVEITGSEDAEPGTHSITFSLFEETRFDDFRFGALTFNLAEETGCHVTTKRELMLTSTSIVDDPVRTSFASPPGDPRRGVWTFGRLMRDMAPTPDQAPAFTLKLFQHWLSDQTVNGFTVGARPEMQQVVLDSWPRLADGSLDLDRAPMRLLAIVNRLDLRDLDKGHAGEGRFVFGVLDPSGFPMEFTVIVEYHLPATTEQDVLDWAASWHALSNHPFPSEEYNAALEALTLRFSGRNVAPNQPNGNSLAQLRTNEIALEPRWQLREFTIGTDGFLQESPIKLTPDLSFNGTSTLADFINQNEAAIVAERHVVPPQFEGQNFLGGSVFNDLIFWDAPGIASSEARHKFSLNTCNGCHGPETNTAFLQISPRFPGNEASLSAFLTGTTVFDPDTFVPRTLNDLNRRRTDLTGLVCPPSQGGTTGGGATGSSGNTIGGSTGGIVGGGSGGIVGGGSGGTIGGSTGVIAPAAATVTPTTSVRKGIGRVD